MNLDLPALLVLKGIFKVFPLFCVLAIKTHVNKTQPQPS